MTDLILRVVDLTRPLLRLAGVDYPRFRAILEVKLRLDSLRNSPASRPAGHDGTRGPVNTFVVSLIVFGLVGVIAAYILGMSGSLLFGFTFVHSFVMLLVGMALISDYSGILLDTTDHQILVPRPVSFRTILVARIAHVTIYVSFLTLSLTATSLAVTYARFGWRVLLAFGATLVLNGMLAMGLVVLVYVTVMRFVNEEKVRDAILYFQIVMSVAMVVGYQLVPRVVSTSDLSTVDVGHGAWVYFYPPVWLAALVALAARTTGSSHVIPALLGLVIPMVAFGAVVVFGSAFRVGRGTEGRTRESAGNRRTRPAAAFGRLLTRGGEELAAFEWTWSLCSGSRHFKLRVYPNVAMVFVLSVLAVVTDPGRSFVEAIEALPVTNKHLIPLYISAMFVYAAGAEVRFIDRADAAWIYRVVPIARPGRILLGVWKAVAVRFMMPVYLVVGGTVLLIWGLGAVPDIALATICSCGLSLVFALCHDPRALPFSLPPPAAQRVIRNLGTGLLAGMMGGLHWGLTFVPLGVPTAIPFALLVTLLLARAYARTPWSSIRIPA